MPTGYTHAVQTGEITDLRSFALLCARGMGALITMRDDPADAPIPEKIEPSDFYTKYLATARARLDELKAMTSEQKAAGAKADFADEHAAWAKRGAESAEQRQRYEAMLALVEAWQTNAEGIRDFMLSQLRESINFDCGGRSYDKEPVALAPDAWWRREIEKTTEQIGRYAEEQAKEEARAAGRTRWLQDLRASLPEAAA